VCPNVAAGRLTPLSFASPGRPPWANVIPEVEPLGDLDVEETEVYFQL